ncbi:hypothetical protein EJ08DRAFT_193307 [Tothia fuscella]|uniref:Uncharacterized protein n=1 Tax=Tothia fuscella TaxID=1048955 RepID=A0A9P4NTZ4_9PEZI|nr:hypothetical protein EJ08DRAFT_193307 [Tothia fuscella]
MLLIAGNSKKADDAKGYDIKEDELTMFEYRTLWPVSVSLAIAVGSMTAQALMDKSLDTPGTLIINSRYSRLSARAIYVIINLCLPLVVNLHKFSILVLGAFCLHWSYNGNSLPARRGVVA